MPTHFATGLVWFRRDLRLTDNAALAAALAQCQTLHCVFVLDAQILQSLPRHDRRVVFIRESLVALDDALRKASGKEAGGLIVLHGDPTHEIPQIAEKLGAEAVFCAHDYETYAKQRDASVARTLSTQGRQLRTVKDHVIFENREIRTQTDTPYSVFTPYLRAWRAHLELTNAALAHTASAGALATSLADRPDGLRSPVPTLESFGFNTPVDGAGPNHTALHGGEDAAHALLEDFFPRMDRYHETRDFPAVKGPSYLSVHLRFGTVSIRSLVRLAMQARAGGSKGAEIWLSELAWRDFYFQILANFPHVSNGAFRPEYDRITWETGPLAEARFAAWCDGQTGYPLVDAAMRQLRQTGYMHNRLRMVAGSFLVKHLGIDWRKGEAFFARELNDFDLAANNGGWQWVSSSGCDAQPYFRIFNPITQSEKFDASGKFIRRYVPELAALSDKAIHAPWMAKPIELQGAGLVLGRDYPFPVVDHAQARATTLARYAAIRAAAAQ